jgi:hypothetical protein
MGSRPLSWNQAVDRQISSWVGDHQRIPAVVCFWFFFGLFVSGRWINRCVKEVSHIVLKSSELRSRWITFWYQHSWLLSPAVTPCRVANFTSVELLFFQKGRDFLFPLVLRQVPKPFHSLVAIARTPKRKCHTIFLFLRFWWYSCAMASHVHQRR